MTGQVLRVMASANPDVHISPTGLFHIGGLNISNSILFGWISAVIVVVSMIFIARRITVKPKGGVYQFVEVIVDYMSGTIEGAFDEKKRSQKYLLYFIPLFFFILIDNLLGLIPGIGDPVTYHGNPLLRPFTA